MTIVSKYARVLVGETEWEEEITPTLIGKVNVGDVVAVALPYEDGFAIGEVVALQNAAKHGKGGLGEVVNIVRPAGAKSLAERREAAKAIARRLNERSEFIAAVKTAAENCGASPKKLRRIADETSLALLAELQELDPTDDAVAEIVASIPVSGECEATEPGSEWAFENFLKKEEFDPAE